MNLVLEIQEDGQRRLLPLVDAEVGIGRGTENAVVIQDPRSSRLHCVLRRTPQGVLLEDLKSRNGTLLNGTAVTRSLVRLGDTFEVGQVRFALRDGAGDDAPAAGTGSVAAPSAADNDESLSASKTISDGRFTREPANAAETITAAPVSTAKLDGVWLEGVDGTYKGQRVEVTKSPFVMGRGDSCDFTLDDKRASGKHAQIHLSKSKYYVEDLNSTNGTAINKKPIRRAILKTGYVLLVGSHSFRVHLPESAGTASAPAPAAGAFEEEEASEFDMERFLAASGSTSIWPMLVVPLLIIVVLFSAWDVARRVFDREASDPVATENLVRSNWSFESPLAGDNTVPGWRLAEGSNGTLRLDTQLAQPPGYQALRLSSNQGSGLCRAFSTDEIGVTNDRKYRLTGFVANRSGAFAAGLLVEWYRARSGGMVLLGRSFSDLARESGELVDVDVILTAPPGAGSARVGGYVFGSGEAVFDRVSLSEWTVTEGTEDGAALPLEGTTFAAGQSGRRIQLHLGSEGTSSVRVGTRALLTTIWAGFSPPRDSLVVGPRMAPLRQGTPDGGDLLLVQELPDELARRWVTVEQTVAASRDRIALRWRSGLESDGELADESDGTSHGLRLFIEARSSTPLVAQGETLERFSVVEADGGPFRELVFGEGAERVSLYFETPVKLSTLEDPSRERRKLLVAEPVDALDSLELVVAHGARFEAAEARLRIEAAARSYRDGTIGAALKQLDEIANEFKNQPEAVREARERMESWQQEAEAGQRRLESELSEFRRLPSRAMYGMLRTWATSFGQRYQGSPHGSEGARLLAEVEEIWAARQSATRGSSATDFLERGKSLFASGGIALAQYYLERAIEADPDGKLAEEAKHVLLRIQKRRETQKQILLLK